jgi:hypothetical protein
VPALRISPVLGAFLLTAAVRGLVALSRMDSLGLELYSGSLAEAWRAGMPLDETGLPIISHLRGSVVVAALLVPLFAFTGPVLGALKLVAVLWSSATAAAIAALLGRTHGRRAAWAGALAFAFLPPSFQMVDVMAMGSHGDVILPVVLALLATLSPPREGVRELGRMALLGALVGAGLFFSFQFVIVLPALALAAHFRDAGASEPRPAVSRISGLFVLGAAAAPFLVLARRLSAGTELVNKSPWDHFHGGGIVGTLRKLRETLLWNDPKWPWELRVPDLPRSWLFEDHGGAWLTWVFAGAALCGLALATARLPRRDPLAGFCVLYAAGMLAAYSASDFVLFFYNRLDGVGSRYLFPLLLPLVLCTGAGVEALAARGRRVLALALLAAACVPGALGFASLLRPSVGLEQPTVRATEYHVFGDHLRHAGGRDLEARVRWAMRVDPDWSATHPYSYTGLLADVIAAPGDSPDDVLAALRRVPALPDALRPFAAATLGAQAGPADAARVAEARDGLDEESLRWFLRGWGRSRSEPISLHFWRGPAPHEVTLPPVLPADLELHAVEGLGFQVGNRVHAYHRVLLEIARAAARLDPPARDTFYRAFALGFRKRFAEGSWELPPPGALSMEVLLPPEARAQFRAGLALPPGAVDAAPGR